MKAICLLLTLLAMVATTHAEERPLPQEWDYAAAMTKVAKEFHGRPGVVLHIGDSITYANPYGGWARDGQGKTDADKAALSWMHSGKNDDTDGWYLARYDHPDGGRSYTACGGLRADELLAGGKRNMPPLEKLLDTYKPQMVVLMIGTNDVSASRNVDACIADVDKSVRLMLDRGIICILSTIPPHVGKPELAKSYNDSLRKLARTRELPLIDFEREILARRPSNWNGTLLQKDNVHPTATQGAVTSSSEPTAENLKNCGYLLRGWLSVKKIQEVKAKALDRD